MDHAFPAPHPQIHHNPPMPLVLKNVTMKEWATSALVTGGATTFFFFSRHVVGMRGAAAFGGFFVGATGCLFACYQRASMRLMGYAINTAEVKKYKFRQDTVGVDAVRTVRE